MIFDESEPLKRKPALKPLDPMSVGELEDYIAEMRTEIARVEAEIVKKKAHRAAIDGLFKS